MNKVHLIGNLTNEPTLRYTQQNTAVASYSIAINTRYGEKQETLFMNIVTWGKSAEYISQYIKKGQTVAITGRLKDNSYEDKEGKKHNSIVVVTEEIEAVGNRKQQEVKEEKIEETKSHISSGTDYGVGSTSNGHIAQSFDLTDDDIDSMLPF